MKYQLAQTNIAKFRLPQDHPVNADFVNNIDRVNQLAESQSGFIWRFTGAEDLVTEVFGESNIAFNMSVWSDMDALASFVYRNKAHRGIMRRRNEWFETVEFHMALWWVEQGCKPSVEEAKHRLETLEKNGPSLSAFTFKAPFSAPDSD